MDCVVVPSVVFAHEREHGALTDGDDPPEAARPRELRK